jgi:hypothetical protein
MRSGGQRPWWLVVRACPRLARMSVNQKRGHGGATKKVIDDHLPTGYLYTTLPLLVIDAPPSLACSLLHDVVALAGVDSA